MLPLLLATMLATSPTTTPASSPPPVAASAPPVPTAPPTASTSFKAIISAYAERTSGTNTTGAFDTASGADLLSRSDISNALLSFTKNTGVLRYGVTTGLYAIPVIGQAVNPTTQTNVNTGAYGWIPQAYLAYAPNANLVISAGKLATLLGQESNFTYQNLNVQRGLGWNAEPTFSRGVRAAYTNRKLAATLEVNDGFYSGHFLGFEGLFGWAPSSATNVQIAFVLPNRNAPPNPTASIANKRELDLMITQQFGKLQLLPYYLFISSPPAPSLGYMKVENAAAAALLVSYTLNPALSLGARYEYFSNASAPTDTGANADFLGYGSGSAARTLTLTPQYTFHNAFVRAEVSRVNATHVTPGFGFGTIGTGTTQTRLLVEAGVITP